MERSLRFAANEDGLIPYNYAFRLFQAKAVPIFRPLLDERLSSCSGESFGSAKEVSLFGLYQFGRLTRLRSFVSRCASGERLRKSRNWTRDAYRRRQRRGVTKNVSASSFIVT